MNTKNEKINADGYKVVRNEKEAQDIIGILRREGYTRISNCFWYEEWKFGNHVFTIERDF